jgi:hypothetical protein
MADEALPARVSRLSVWIILIGILVSGLLVYGFCVPYRSWTLTIDRRTGAFHYHGSYFGIPLVRNRPAAVPTRGHPIGKVPMTAPERSITVRQRSKRFPWSEAIVERDDEVGVWFAEAYFQLFYVVGNPNDPKAKQLSDEEVDQLVRQRISAWNSKHLDRDPRAIAGAAKQENSELLGIPVGYTFIKQP